MNLIYVCPWIVVNAQRRKLTRCYWMAYWTYNLLNKGNVKYEKCNIKYEKSNIKYEKCNVKYEKYNVKYEKCNVKHEKDNVKYEEENVKYEKGNVKYVPSLYMYLVSNIPLCVRYLKSYKGKYFVTRYTVNIIPSITMKLSPILIDLYTREHEVLYFCTACSYSVLCNMTQPNYKIYFLRHTSLSIFYVHLTKKCSKISNDILRGSVHRL